MTSRTARAALRAGVALALLVSPPPARAQRNAAEEADEPQRLREAAALEAAGDYGAADSILRELLQENPASLGALLSRERILTLGGRAADLLPNLDTLLSTDPTSVVAHQMRVRTLSVLNMVSALEHAADEWINAMPAVETPYREIARIWSRRGAIDRSIEVLEQGRRRVGRRDALALELGDAWALFGDAGKVATEWSRAIGPRGEALMLVQRRLAAMPDGGASVTPGLVDALVGSDATPARTRAGVHLAVDAGLERRAEEIAVDLLPRLEEKSRRSFLVELGRRADGAGLGRLALRVYALLVSTGGEEERLLPVRSRMAELALALGDTGQAAEMYREVAGELAPGSPQRRQAMALRVQMLARESSFDSALAELDRLTLESGSRPEADVAAAVLANALIDAGRPVDAKRMLDGLEGAHSSLARGRVWMTLGDVERARVEVLSAANRLAGPDATEAIRLAALLGRLSHHGGALMSEGLAAIAAGDEREGVMRLYVGSDGLPSGERAAILDFAAGLADRVGLDAEAAQLRRDIVSETPGSPEAAPALLALARSRLDDEAATEARLLLERLVQDYPRSALAPQARRELERMGTQKLRR